MTNDPLNSERKEDSDSVIHVFFDTLGIKKIVKQLFNLFRIKTTTQFIDGFILFVYLSLLFTSLELINWNHFSVIVTLFLIGLFIIFELIGKNTDVLKRFLFSEDSNKWFIENINSFSYDQIRYKIQNRVFSFANISLLLQKVNQNSELNAIPIVEGVVEKNDLSKENLDQIFSPAFLGIFRESFIHYLLMRFKNDLSIGNIMNVYTFYKSNDLMVKMLFATQKQSELLINPANNDPRLKLYFKQYQYDKSTDLKKLDEKISINFVKIRTAIIFSMIALCSLILYYILKSTNPVTIENIIAIMIFALMLTLVILTPLMGLVINPWLSSYRDDARKQFVEYIKKTV